MLDKYYCATNSKIDDELDQVHVAVNSTLGTQAHVGF